MNNLLLMRIDDPYFLKEDKTFSKQHEIDLRQTSFHEGKGTNDKIILEVLMAVGVLMLGAGIAGLQPIAHAQDVPNNTAELYIYGKNWFGITICWVSSTWTFEYDTSAGAFVLNNQYTFHVQNTGGIEGGSWGSSKSSESTSALNYEDASFSMCWGQLSGTAYNDVNAWSSNQVIQYAGVLNFASYQKGPGIIPIGFEIPIDF